ncbi:uncharacterized protein LOC142343219 [Convolutriloba macropyga]|uniref:uncharacterized protein LOC142343219 n=1 Tax=Convolutriloba macropyga TaxID=536237 RepID=UPI003F527F7B
MPFKLFSCCVSEAKKPPGEAYEKKEDTAPKPQSDAAADGSVNATTAVTTANAAKDQEQPKPELEKETEKVSKRLNLAGLNLTAQRLLLGDSVDDVARHTRSVRLNVYGVPDNSLFNSIFYASILPEIESKCSELSYEVELLDLASNDDQSAAVFYDENFNVKDLIQCQGYKRGPYRSFNLIVIPNSSIESQFLAPVIEAEDFKVITSLEASDDAKTLISENYEEVEDGSAFRLKRALKLSKRKEVTTAIFEVLNSEAASQSLQEKYCSPPFEQIVTYLFTHATDVRETTCVLYLNDSSAEATTPGSTADTTSNRAKTLANTIRAQLPTSSFVEISESTFETSKGKQISSVLGKMLESFCSEYERLSYIVDSLPIGLHNELLTHNNHLAELGKHLPKVDIFNQLELKIESDFVTCVSCEDAFQRQLMFAKKLVEIGSPEGSTVDATTTGSDAIDQLLTHSNVIKLFRFCNASPSSLSSGCLKHSLREQICYLSGEHPSAASDLDLMQVLSTLVTETDQSVVIALDDIDDVSWIPSHDKYNGKVHFFLTSSSAETFEGKIKNGTVAKFGTNANVEVLILKDRLKQLVSSDSDDEVFPDIAKLLSEDLHMACSVALKHVAVSPLMFSQAELRLALSFEEQIGHSLAIEALQILLSPLLFKVYTSTSQYYTMVRNNQLAHKLSSTISDDHFSILQKFKSDSLAKIIEHSLTFQNSANDASTNTLLAKRRFPNLPGLKLDDSSESSCEPLPELGALIGTVSPQIYTEYIKCQEKGESEADFTMLVEALQYSQYSLTLAANVTYKSEFYSFLNQKKSAGELEESKHPFCWKVLQQVSSCPTVPKVSPAKAEVDEASATMRPRTIKMITWLNAEGAKDFMFVLSENQSPSATPKGRLEVIRVADMKIVRRIDMTKIPVDVKNIDLTSCVVNTERILKWIDLDEGALKVQLKSQLNIDYQCYGVQSPDQIVAMSRNKMYVNGVQLSTNKTNFSFKVGEDRFLNSLLLAPDGSYCACGDTVQKPMPLLIWDLKQKILIHDIRLHDHEFDMQLAMVSNHYIAVVVKHIDPDPLNFVNVYEFSSQYNKYKFHEDASVTSLVLTPDDHNLILGLADCSVVIHHLGSSDTPIYLTGIHKSPVDLMRCNLDASVLLTCCTSANPKFSDRTINLFSVTSGDLLGSFTPHTHFTCVEISPAGRSFLYGTNEDSSLIKVSFGTDGSAESDKLPSDQAVFGSQTNECKHSSI